MLIVTNIKKKHFFRLLYGYYQSYCKDISKYCCPIKPLYTAISSLNPAEIGMISSYFKLLVSDKTFLELSVLVKIGLNL